MIITNKNISQIIDKPRYIAIPHGMIIRTFLVHLFIINIGVVLLYNVYSYIAVPLLFFEVFYYFYFLRKIWTKVGYSFFCFFSIFFITIVVDFILSPLERNFFIWLIFDIIL